MSESRIAFLAFDDRDGRFPEAVRIPSDDKQASMEWLADQFLSKGYAVEVSVHEVTVFDNGAEYVYYGFDVE